MKKEFYLTDADNERFEIKLSIENGEFSMSSQNGQGKFKPKTEAQKRLLNLWDKYHLNDMNAGTIKQTKLLNDKFVYDRTKDCRYTQEVEFLDCHTIDGKPLTVIEQKDILNQRRLQVVEASRIKDLNKSIEDLEFEVRQSRKDWVTKKVGKPLADHIINKLGHLSGIRRPDGKEEYIAVYVDQSRSRVLNLCMRIKELKIDFVQDDKPFLATALYDLHPETGSLYKYGTAWLKFALPDDIEDTVKEIIELIESETPQLSIVEQFVKDCHLTITKSKKGYEKYFPSDKDKRYVWNITIESPNGKYEFTFGNSIANGDSEPDDYSILACLDICYCDDIDEFMCEFGYSVPDTHTMDQMNAIWNSIQKQNEGIKLVFNEDQIEKLHEIN